MSRGTRSSHFFIVRLRRCTKLLPSFSYFAIMYFRDISAENTVCTKTEIYRKWYHSEILFSSKFLPSFIRSSSFSTNMSVEDCYYKFNRILLKSLGLWPYQDSKWACVQATFMTIMYLSAIFVQLAVFITHECTMDVLIKVFSFVFPTIFMFYTYYLYYLKSDTIKEIMENMYQDWKFFKNKAELDILNDYANLAKQFTEIFLFCLCVGIITTMMCHIIPITLDIVSPVNVSRAEDLHVAVEYFVDQSKYCYVLILHLTVFVCLGLTTVISVGITLYGYALHACALFKVANYRMEITMDKDILRIPNPQRQHVIRDRLICAVITHRRAFLFCDLLMQNLQRSFLFITIIGVVSLSINLFRVSKSIFCTIYFSRSTKYLLNVHLTLQFLKAITAFEEVIEIIIPSILIFFHFVYMFLGNHVGQQITNTNAEIFNIICSLPWYTASLNVQKLLPFLLQKSSKHFCISLGGIFNASYEGFTMLSKLSISYFTVLYAVQ
ncbi:uncharacterized protein LOC105189208 isoform X2 [Harpegnathos saltator]|uniref:uncharacterized protein LOC105189208 isoform X2 n=1 Tax=Harpegnathos saltator TaxID=610380 RepID=UPI000948B8AF|nr:uncharacterized protein LOC105189208 isoform X2 [Harpegnathos saltator]